ncbi:hypothetical protein MMC17_008921 [Xylographa soralifera]|nr:hypothetical protein [Xylographa soralifera]
MEEYVYSPLESPEHIRLLELLPCYQDQKAPLSCRLRQITLKDAENQYEAISYAWGSERTEIVCEDRKVTVSSNLPKALTTLRFKYTVRLLWVDTLCINQSRDPTALAERVQQVRLMNRIYSNARSVIVYLGEVSDDDEILLSCISEVASISDHEWASATAKFGYIFTPNAFLTDTYEMPGQTTTWSSRLQQAAMRILWIFGHKPETPAWEKAFENPKIWVAFCKFLARPWFQRMWVVQEYALARNLQILLGEHLESHDFLLRSVTKLLAHWLCISPSIVLSIGKQDLLSTQDCEAVRRLLQIGHSYRASNRRLFSFPELFHLTRLFKCSDDHDRIYGILGLVDQQDRDILFIDYNEDLMGLAERVSRFLIQKGHGIYVLYNSIGSNAGGPSWVCKITRTWSDSLTDSVAMNGTGIFSNACGTMNAGPCAFRGQTLVMCGWIIDSVTDMTSALVDSRKNLPDSNKLRLEWQLEVFEWVNRHAHGSSSFSLSCWRAVVADVVFTQYPQRGRDFPGFEQHVRPFEAYCTVFKEFNTLGPGNTTFDVPTFRAICNRAAPFLKSLSAMSYGKRLGITEKHGILCQLPEQAQPNDFVAIIVGCPIPFVLRPQGKHYSLVGCCYLDNLMDGQVVEKKEWTVQEIMLQ